MNRQSTDQTNQIRRLQQRVKDFERLSKVVEIISSAVSVEDTVKNILKEATKLCRADQSSIVLFELAGEQTAKTLLREGAATPETLDYSLNRLLAGWIIVNNKPLLCDDLQEVLGKVEIQPRYKDIKSVLSVPLVLKGKTIGVINLVAESEEKKFGQRELHLMTILAGQCTQFIHNARLYEELFSETNHLKSELQDRYARHGIIGSSPSMQKVFSLLDRVIPTEVQVLLHGETGTGKERIARAIHYSGPRKDAPFVAVDCGALPANLLESELFGYVKGAFTGANQDRKGLFEEANGGTLFLDEITNMPLEVQSKLLRAVQEHEIRPVGSSQTRKIDVRLIASGSSDLATQVEKGKFREDLFYRLNVVNITLPPLRERREDIAILADHFLVSMKKKHGKQLKGFNPETIRHLEAYSWPGNVRELEHAVERAVVLSQDEQLTNADFIFRQNNSSESDGLFRPRPLRTAFYELKREYISQVLQHTDGSQKDAAQILQIQPPNLSRLIKNLKIKTL